MGLTHEAQPREVRPHEARPRYWEWRAELEASRDRLRLAAVGLGLGCLVLVGLVLWQARRPTPIYYMTGAVGTAWPGQVPDQVVEDFGSHVVALIGNVNPSTARQVYDLAPRYLSPAMSTRLTMQAKEELAAIEAQRLGMSFAQRSVGVIEKTPDPPVWELLITGVRTAWAGQQLLSQDAVEYQVRVIRAAATELNPYGLAVDTLQLRKPSVETSRSPGVSGGTH